MPILVFEYYNIYLKLLLIILFLMYLDFYLNSVALIFTNYIVYSIILKIFKLIDNDVSQYRIRLKK